MWRVKTDAKFENSFFPVLIYWSDNRIHLGTIKKWTFVLLVPPPMTKCSLQENGHMCQFFFLIFVTILTSKDLIMSI